MINQFNVIGIAGSLRRDSYNLSLLKYVQKLSSENFRIKILSLKDIPLYNDDLIPDSIPETIHNLRKSVSQANAVIIACPEYNYSIPGVLKNALDWLSTNAIGNVLDGKLVGLIGASKTGFGTVRAQLHLRQVLYAINADVVKRPEIHVSKAGNVFNSNGEISDKGITIKIRKLLSEFETRLQN